MSRLVFTISSVLNGPVVQQVREPSEVRHKYIFYGSVVDGFSFKCAHNTVASRLCFIPMQRSPAVASDVNLELDVTY